MSAFSGVVVGLRRGGFSLCRGKFAGGFVDIILDRAVCRPGGKWLDSGLKENIL